MSTAASIATLTPVKRGRVRTGCLTCRSRKVKCDEGRPFCFNCTRLNRICTYEPQSLPDTTSHESQNLRSYPLEAELSTWETRSHDTLHDKQMGTQLPQPTDWPDNADLLSASFDYTSITGEWGDLFVPEATIISIPDQSSEFTTNGELHGHHTDSGGSSSFKYFTSHVNPPFITPWDSMNWEIARVYIADLGNSDKTITCAIKAVEALSFKSSESSDDTAAMQRYLTAKRSYLDLLKDYDTSIETVFIATFLLCCFEVVAQQDTVSNTLKQDGDFITRLEIWAQIQPWSPLVCRIIAWLRMFNTKALHFGGRGILCPRVLELLPQAYYPLPSLTFLQNNSNISVDVMTDSFYQSIFHFYYELQDISTQASALNRHHRSRGTPADEILVSHISAGIERRLDYLWQTKPPILDCDRDTLMSMYGAKEFEVRKLLHVIGLCKACYHAEIIYHARAHGRSLSPESKSLEAKRQIRLLVDNTHTISGTRNLHPAFIWPLFIYAVESTTQEEVGWALEKLTLVDDPLWRTDFIKQFTTDLSSEQLRKGERVDSRYFCMATYGVLPAFM